MDKDTVKEIANAAKDSIDKDKFSTVLKLGIIGATAIVALFIGLAHEVIKPIVNSENKNHNDGEESPEIIEDYEENINQITGEENGL